MTQGSSFLATLGFGTKSRWDFMPRPDADTLRGNPDEHVWGKFLKDYRETDW
jgi:hypothetical protein